MADQLSYATNAYEIDTANSRLSVSGYNNLTSVSLPSIASLSFDFNGASVEFNADQFNFTSVTGGFTNNHIIIYAEGNSSLDLSKVEFTNYNTGPSISNMSLTVQGTSGNDTVTGSSVGDRFTAYSGNDSLLGGAGDDVFEFGVNLTSSDTLFGGDGYDVLSYTDSMRTGADLNNVQEIEELDLGDASTAIVSRDTLVASGKTLLVNGLALGQEHSLSFDGSAETDGSFNIYGGSGGDTLVGGALADTLTGGAGNDSLMGGDGNDSFIMGAGDASDTVDGGLGTNAMTLGADVVNDDYFTHVGNVQELVFSSQGGVSAVLSAEAQSAGIVQVDASTSSGDVSVDASGYTVSVGITGGSSANVLVGGSGADTLSGGLSSRNSIAGGAGDDTITVVNLSFTTEAASVLGTSIQEASSSSISGGDGDDTVVMLGLAASNSVDGGSGTNTLVINDPNATIESLRTGIFTNFTTIVFNNEIVNMADIGQVGADDQYQLSTPRFGVASDTDTVGALYSGLQH